jgi:hypothetical protein
VGHRCPDGIVIGFMKGPLPTFVIIGAQKCGTTALHAYLARHPQISMSRPKETDFFVSGESGNWERGIDWYRQRFDPDVKARGDASPNYTAHPHLPGVPERMAELLPEAKLIFMVRDPVDRVRANWIHTYSNRKEFRPMREAVLEEPSEYIDRSKYHLQLTRFLDHYPLERIMVIEQDELLNDRRETLRRVFNFVGVRDNVWRDTYSEPRLETAARRRKTPLGAFMVRHVSPKMWRRMRHHWPLSLPFDHPEMEADLRAEVADRLRDDAARFRELVGRPFEGWSV